jgi:phosphoribosyl-dephospho-CoA transferase
MQTSKIDDSQVHDLLQIDPHSVNDISAPCWVKQALRSCPWAVTRRAQAPADEIAVGVRGNTRSERWGGFLKKNFINKMVRPAELLEFGRSATLITRTLAFRALREVIERWRDLSLQWGPAGSVGFELASGRHTTTEGSDLDIAIRAPFRMTQEKALSLCHRMIGLQVRVDVRVETPQCGFSLREYACTSSARMLLHYPEGVRLGSDPWLNESSKNAAPASTPLVTTL